MTVSAKDLGTDKEQSVNVVPTSGLNEADIDRIIGEAAESADQDKQRLDLAAAKNKAESLLYTSQRALEEFGEVLGPAERDNLEQDLQDARNAIDVGTIDQVKEVLLRLEESAQRIGEIIYAQVNEDDANADKAEAAAESGADDEAESSENSESSGSSEKAAPAKDG